VSRYFNTAGPCRADRHFMLPAEARCLDLDKLIERGQFFVLHAPRQTGKTTLIQEAVRRIRAEGRYHALYCSLETVQGVVEAEQGIPAVLNALRRSIRYSDSEGLGAFPPLESEALNTALVNALSDVCAASTKPLVIMFDEVDCLSDQTLISFLRQLRQGYVERSEIPFVHSLALVGMRNIRDYQARLRPDSETLGSASPFNIVAETLRIRDFSRDEISELYSQHTDETGQAFPGALIDRVYDETRGQPWLCNAIAREIVENQLGAGEEISLDHVESAVERIILRRDTHIDSLLERLEEPRVRRVVEPVIAGRQADFDVTDPDAAYVFDLGLLRMENGDVVPANRIYGEIIVRVLTLSDQNRLPNTLQGGFINEGQLDMTGLLKAFQQFWRENSAIWIEKHIYREAGPHLVLQAYLQRVINGGGRIQREYSAGRGRIDLCLHLGGHAYPLELKIHRGEKTIEDGLDQLGDYMDIFGAEEGWLVVFDPREIAWGEKISWQKTTHAGKAIHIVGC